MAIWGVDVSHYQGNVDWSAVRAGGASFAFCKASEGTTTVDPRFADNWQALEAAGLMRGAYHFGHPGFDADTQAVHFHSVVGALKPGDLPPVLDIETSDGHPVSVVVPWVLNFVARAESLFGRKLVIYTGGFWKSTLGDPVVPELSAHPLWLANYGQSPVLPRAWSAWTFWQYTNGQIGDPGPVPGVTGLCDRSRFAGDVAALRGLTTQVPQPSSVAQPAPGASAAAVSTGSWPGCYLVCPCSAPVPAEAVRSWQRRMNTLGFPLVVDDNYGPACKTACLAFQRDRGLNADGIVGPTTWSAAFAP